MNENRVLLLEGVCVDRDVVVDGTIPYGKGTLPRKVPGNELTLTVSLRWVDLEEVEGFEVRTLKAPSPYRDIEYEWQIYVKP